MSAARSRRLCGPPLLVLGAGFAVAAAYDAVPGLKEGRWRSLRGGCSSRSRGRPSSVRCRFLRSGTGDSAREVDASGRETRLRPGCTATAARDAARRVMQDGQVRRHCCCWPSRPTIMRRSARRYDTIASCWKAAACQPRRLHHVRQHPGQHHRDRPARPHVRHPRPVATRTPLTHPETPARCCPPGAHTWRTAAGHNRINQAPCESHRVDPGPTRSKGQR